MWKTCFSTSQQRNYYLHADSGRKSWSPPVKETEDALIKIQAFFQQTKMISDDSEGFLSFLKEAMLQESSTDLGHNSEMGLPFSVLDIGCNVSKDIRLFHALGCSVYNGFDTCQDAIKSISEMNLHGVSTKVNVKTANIFNESTWTYKDIDLAVCYHTLDYTCIDKENSHAIFSWINKCLSKQGRILLLLHESSGPDYSVYQLHSSDGECPAFRMSKETVKKLIGLECVIDENVAVLATWMGINSPITTIERQFMYSGTHRAKLLKWCKTETPSGIAWLHASKYRIMLFRKGGVIGNTMRDSLKEWKSRLKSGTLGDII